jgi:hypothetical protein
MDGPYPLTNSWVMYLVMTGRLWTVARELPVFGVYLIAGTPAHWRTSSSDADPNSEFVDVWLNEFDAISPWTVGRYSNEDEADRFAEDNLKGDVEFLKKRNEQGSGSKVDYMPVVFPGGSVSVNLTFRVADL